MMHWPMLAIHQQPQQRPPQGHATRIIPEPIAIWISRIGTLIERQKAIPHDRCSWDEMNIQETVAMPARKGMSSTQYNWMQNPWTYSPTQRTPCWTQT